MKIGFIGCGNMAAAMLNGILKAGILKPEELTASAVSSATRDKIRQELHFRILFFWRSSRSIMRR